MAFKDVRLKARRINTCPFVWLGLTCCHLYNECFYTFVGVDEFRINYVKLNYSCIFSSVPDVRASAQPSQLHRQCIPP